MVHQITRRVSLSLAALLPALCMAQSPSTDAREQVRAARKADARDAAKIEQPGERYPYPLPDLAKPRPTASERTSARAARKIEGAEAARETKSGEGDGIPAPAAKVSRADRLAARKARNAETARENKAGEIKSKGETSY